MTARQQRVQLIVAGRMHLDEALRAIVTSPIHSAQRQAMQVGIELGGRPKALDQRDGTTVTVLGQNPGSRQQMAREHALHHLRHRRDQLGLRSLRNPWASMPHSRMASNSSLMNRGNSTPVLASA